MNENEEQNNKGPKTPRLIKQDKMDIDYNKLKVNNQNDNKQFNVQLIVLEEVKKLKINLEITDRNKLKTLYTNSITLEELINLNKFFSKFKDYSEAFNHILKNFTKIDRNKVFYLNNNKEIKISLLFSLNDISQINKTDIIEESIEIILYYYNSNSNKTLANITLVINNLKISLEKFNLMIKELKSNVNNDKLEKERKINELEKNFNMKLNEIKNDKILLELKTKIENIEKNGINLSQKGMQENKIEVDTGTGPDYFDEKFYEIFSKMEEYDNDINSIRKNIEERYVWHKNELNKNNKIFLEKENELSILLTDKFQEFFNKINSLEENIKNNEKKNEELENYVNDKALELDNKTNICFNELIKKISKKSVNGNIPEEDIKIKLNAIINKLVENNNDRAKNYENRMNQKINDLEKLINEQITNKINIFEEKITNLNNLISNLEEVHNKNKLIQNENINEENKQEEDNRDNNINMNIKIKELEEKINKFENIINNSNNITNNKDNINTNTNNNINNNTNNNINDIENKLINFNNLITKKFDEVEQYKKNIDEKITKNELKINDIDTQVIEICEEISKNKTEEKKDEDVIVDDKTEIKNIQEDIKYINSDIKNNINPKLDELTNKIKETNIQAINIIETKVKSLQKKIENNSKVNTNDKQKEIISKNNKIIEEINRLKEENNKNINETKNYIEKNNREINNKLSEVKKEIYAMINKINEHIKDDNKDINGKIFNIRNDLLKIFDNKNFLIENKIKLNEGKIMNLENKINKVTKDNQSYFDKLNIIEKGSKLNNDLTKSNDYKLRDLEINYKSMDVKLNYLDNKIKQADSNKELKKSKDFTNKIFGNIINNGNSIPKTNISIYKNNALRNVNKYLYINSSDTEEEIIAHRNSSYFTFPNLNKNNLSKDKNNIFVLTVDTNILKKEDLNENFFLFSKLKEIYQYNRFIKLKLLYRATKDGDSAKDFHKICDLIGPNITLVKTKKGYIFGGFTIKNWKHYFKDIKKDDPDYGTEIKDEKAFGFSINKKKIYENGKPSENIIFCNKNFGPCFKNYFFKIFDESLKNGGICGKIEESNFIGIEKQYEFNGGEEKFEVEEIEVFQIGFR